MQKRIISVSPDTAISEVIRMIFNLGISGVPVVEGKKLIGILTEEDLLKKMFPSVKDLMEDWVRARSFEKMEERLKEIIKGKVQDVMNKEPKCIYPNTPLMQAQSLMILNGFSRLPVVDNNNNLVGIISQGDIFKHLVKNELPAIEAARFATFMKENYDWTVNWEKRLPFEFPPLFELFKKEKIKRVVDLGTWTGKYSIELAKQGGIDVLAIDNNDLMIKIANDKREKLTEDVKEKINFQFSDYDKLSKNIEGQYDAVLCMGGAFSYIYTPLEKLIAEIKSILKKDAIFIAQILNFEKILQRKNRLLGFKIHTKDEGTIKENVILEFIRTANSKWIKHNVAIFDFDGNNWYFSGMTTVKAQHFTKDVLGKAFKKAGFSKVSFSGSMGEFRGDYGPLSFIKPFEPLESDWLNVVARK